MLQRIFISLYIIRYLESFVEELQEFPTLKNYITRGWTKCILSDYNHGRIIRELRTRGHQLYGCGLHWHYEQICFTNFFFLSSYLYQQCVLLYEKAFRKTTTDEPTMNSFPLHLQLIITSSMLQWNKYQFSSVIQLELWYFTRYF